jgi:tetratricopeptide (TPR) repeat protein
LSHYRTRKVDAALAAITQTLRLDPGMAHAYYLLGICLRDQGKMREAVRAFEQAAERSPGMIPAREELADLYGSLGRWNEEVVQLQLLAGLDPVHVDRHVALALAQARAARDARDPAVQERHADLAILTLSNVLEHTENQSAIYAALGQVWLEVAVARNDPIGLRKAIQALERVVFTPGAPSQTLTLYGRALLRAGRPEEAERVLQQATIGYPVDPAAFLEYAAIAERRNHLEAARRALMSYNALVSDEPTFPARALRIGLLSGRLNDPGTAMVWLTRAANAAPGDLRVLTALADAQVHAGDRRGAQTTIGRGLKIDPDNVALLSLARRAA